MPRVRLALVSVCLCLVCLPDASQQRTAISYSRDIIKKVDLLISKVSNVRGLDCRLYTPTRKDYKQNCPGSTLKCFAEEIKVLLEELEAAGFPKISRLQLNLKIETLAKQLNLTESECLQCELLTEEGAEKFLEELKSTINAINSNTSSKLGLSKDTS